MSNDTLHGISDEVKTDPGLAFYAIRGCLESIKEFDETLTRVYGDHPNPEIRADLPQRRLDNHEYLLELLGELVKHHAPDVNVDPVGESDEQE